MKKELNFAKLLGDINFIDTDKAEESENNHSAPVKSIHKASSDVHADLTKSDIFSPQETGEIKTALHG
jgi:hypothetical protein